MVSLLGIIAGIALVLAVVVAGLFIGVCMLIAWLTGGREERGPAQGRGPAQHGMRGMPGMRGGAGIRPPVRQPTASKHRAGSGTPRMPIGPRHGNR
jgi:hypothetical protein